MRLVVENWSKYKRYRADRGAPPWIALHRKLLRNPAWVTMNNDSRSCLIVIWLLAADNDGVIEAPNLEDYLAAVGCMPRPDLSVLVEAGFVTLSDSGRPLSDTPRHAPRKLSAQRQSTEAETEITSLPCAPAHVADGMPTAPPPSNSGPNGPPTEKQVAYIQKMAEALSEQYASPPTYGAASRLIDRMKPKFLRAQSAAESAAIQQGRIDGLVQGRRDQAVEAVEKFVQRGKPND